MSAYPLADQAEAAIASAGSIDELEAIRVKYLGRDGLITHDLRSVAKLPVSERAAKGQLYNAAQGAVMSSLANRRNELAHDLVKVSVEASTVDVTAPTDTVGLGHAHPVNAMIDDIVRIFWQMGYEVADGPEIETPWYNFEALNMPADHPARDMQDTFYLTDGNLPRTHTSNVQIRYMEQHKPPIRIIAPGKAYRNEDEDARHAWMFHQIEGLVVDKDISLSDLKGTLMAMMQGILGEKTDVRLRPNYFPYTEPSVEMDATCVICAGKGCKTCSGTGWLELGGAGMVHPKVLENVGIDPAIYSGFAFGFGPARIAQIKYNVPDLREFWRPDLTFLEQF